MSSCCRSRIHVLDSPLEPLKFPLPYYIFSAHIPLLRPAQRLLRHEQPHTITASSSQKKRKLAWPAAEPSASSHEQQSGPQEQPSPAFFVTSTFAPAPARLSPSSSPRHNSDSPAPSPASSNTTRTTTPPRFLPPHLHDEVLPGKEDSSVGDVKSSGTRQSQSNYGGPPTSLSTGIAHIDIDRARGGTLDMSGDEPGSSHGGHDVNTSVSRTTSRVSARAASPAKRNASAMEETSSHASPDPSDQPPRFLTVHDDSSGDTDVAMSGLTPASAALDSLDATSSGESASVESGAATSSMTSFDMDAPPPYTAPDGTVSSNEQGEPFDTDRVDQQYAFVSAQIDRPIGEGDRGVVISQRWLNRVMSRTSEGLKSNAFSKDAREGIVGPVDNSDIIATGALHDPPLHDPQRSSFVPLKPGLSMNEDYRVVPYRAYEYIVEQYGCRFKYPIVRYAHDTTEGEAMQQNVQFENYPPVITILKVSSSQSAEQPARTQGAIDKLRLKKEREARGQQADDDAIHLVSSRSERFQSFLARSKEAAGIPRSTKVKLWRLLNPSALADSRFNTQQSGVLSPPASREPSPSASPRPNLKLVLDNSAFDQLQLGIDLEHIEVRDETNNGNYNGKSTMELVAINTDQTILLEEQVGGPGGGEFQSDSKKIVRALNKRNTGTAPSSAPQSGRSSPAPGAGIMTRGRARRDGSTRGTVGLTNLGNTCYMNSALQCIRSVEELAVYFTSDAYKKEINNDNPLGHHGAMANAYAGVLRGIYSKTAGGAFTPSEFKKKLGNLQPLFSGYGQQDSQEFLSFLVDALHEDLNRIKKKPYNENPDSDDKTVHDPQAIVDLGEIYRKNHRARNDSVAMDLFSGFYKNTMECPVCDKISITFDPYSLLTVQLPIENAFTHSISFFPMQGNPINHLVDADRNSTVKVLKESIASKHTGVEADRLWMVEVYNHKVYKVFEDNSTLAEVGIGANDNIFLYELENVPKNIASPRKSSGYGGYGRSASDDSIPDEGMASPKADCFAVQVINRAKAFKSSTYDTVMHPLYITVTRDEAQDYDLILKKVLIAVSNITSRPFLTDYSSTPAAKVERDMSTEDAARVSDHSSPSEDGYVNVSMGNASESTSTAEQADELPDNMSSPDADEMRRKVPPGFMLPEYFIDPILRTNLFDMKLAKSGDNLHFATMQTINNSMIRTMHDRVKPPARRSSIQSSSSDNLSGSASDDATEAGKDESDEEDDSRADIILGESQAPMPTIEDSDNDSVDGANAVLGMTNARHGRRRLNRSKKDKSGKRKRPGAYSRNDKAKPGQARGNARSSLASTPVPDDGPYYVQLGEAIILDWQPEAHDRFFAGSADDRDDPRGHRLSTDTGRQMALFNDPELIAKQKRREERKRNGIELEDCFVETGKREVLSEDNAWYCSRCKEMRRAAKTLEIWTIPDILVVHLKRFGGNRSFRDKIDVFVGYPVVGLDMTDKVGLKEDGKEYMYDLFAVDNHFGGLGGGHYTAMAKSFYDGQWYDYNDSSCSKIGNPAKLRSPAAYLLFYRRRSETPLGPKYLQDLLLAARNPTSTEVGNEDAEDSESGEGQLGGLTLSSQHGSSSVSTGAGVAGTRTNPARAVGTVGGRPAGAIALAGSNLTTRLTKTTNNDDVDEEFGEFVDQLHQSAPKSPSLPPYSSQDTPAWSFSVLNQREGSLPDLTDNSMAAGADDADDAISTTADMDRDSAYGDSPKFDNDGFDSVHEQRAFAAGRNSPISEFGGTPEPPSYDLTAPMPASHDDNASMGGVDDDDPPAVDIHVENDVQNKTE